MSPSDSVATTPLGRWAERHGTIISAVVAVLLFLYDAMNLTGQYATLGALSLPLLVVALVLSAGMCAVYVFRFRAPRAAPALLVVAAWGYVLPGVGVSPAPVVLLGLALYIVGARLAWPVVAAGAVLGGGGGVAAGRRQLDLGCLRIGVVGVLVLAGVFVAAGGRLAQSRRRHLVALGDRAAQLAGERDARATIAAGEERSRIAR